MRVKDAKLLHGWGTQIITGEHPKEIDMTLPWNHPRNASCFKRIYWLFINPELRPAALKDSDGFGLNHYAANSHVIGFHPPMKIQDIKDGAANTLVIGEVNAQFQPWGHPINWRDPTIGINRHPSGFGGAPGSGGAHFMMGDGSVRFLNERIHPAVLRALSTPNGAETIPDEKDWYGK